MLTLHFSRKICTFYFSSRELSSHVCAYACFCARYKFRMQIRRVVSLILDNTQRDESVNEGGRAVEKAGEGKTERKELSQIRTIWWIVKGR